MLSGSVTSMLHGTYLYLIHRIITCCDLCIRSLLSRSLGAEVITQGTLRDGDSSPQDCIKTYQVHVKGTSSL